MTIAPDDFDFKELFTANYQHVLRHLILLTGNKTLAEDIAQETFIKLYENPPREFTNLSGWLMKVSTNLAYNHLRGEKNRKKREEAQGFVRDVFEEDFLRTSEAAEARAALRTLDDRDRTCLVLKFSGFSYSEIAQVTGIKESSIGTTIARSLVKFRQAYERTGNHVL
jgi:RNA polymerase sigma factor (sigma-70 family)